MPLKFYYWSCKGWGEPSRLLFHFFNLEYEEITWDDIPGWFAKRDEIFVDPIKTPFPGIPILIDAGFLISGQEEINYYLCKKHGRPDLYGKTLQDEVRVRQINSLLTEAMDLVVKGGVSPDYKANLTKLFKEGGKLKQNVKNLAGFLADKDFLVGYFTISDIRAAHGLKHLRSAALSAGLDDPVVGKYDNLVALIKRVAAVPELADYKENDYPYEPEKYFPWFVIHPLPQSRLLFFTWRRDCFLTQLTYRFNLINE